MNESLDRMESVLMLQAYVDGELSAGASDRVAKWIRNDSDAHALAGELQQTRKTLNAHELPRSVPVSPQFYWSQIARTIDSESQLMNRSSMRERTTRKVAEWLRWVAPVAGVAVVMSAIMFLDKNPGGISSERPALLSVGHAIEIPSQALSIITFRSEQAGMTIVWVGQGR